MPSYQTSINIDSPVERVYDTLVDFGNQPKWRYDLKESVLHSGQAGAVGSVWKMISLFRGKENTGHAELTTAEANRLVSFRTVERKPVQVSGDWHLSSEGSGTRLEFHIDLQPAGIFRLFGPLMKGGIRKTCHRYLDDFKALMEAEGR